MDPDGKWISTRAVLLAAAGQNCWPPAGSYMAATGQDLMAADTLAQHGSCRRSSTSSSLPFRTHVGARNSVVVVDLPRCGPMLSPRVPNLVPIPGPWMERETPGQRPRPNYGHPQAPAW